MGFRFRRAFGLGSKSVRTDIGTGSPYSAKFGRKQHQNGGLLVLVTGCVLGFVLYTALKTFF